MVRNWKKCIGKWRDTMKIGVFCYSFRKHLLATKRSYLELCDTVKEMGTYSDEAVQAKYNQLAEYFVFLADLGYIRWAKQ